jgi:DNA-binding transcriptional MocR family regulator
VESGTLIGQVIATVKQRIAGRILTPGAQLPSIRSLAQTLNISKSTIVEAYERLAAEGIIRSRPGAGFYVAGNLAPLSLVDIGPKLDRAIDPFWISRQSLDAGDAVLKPGCGWLPSSWMPEQALRRSLRTLSRAPDATLTDYGTSLGLPALRQLLARRMSERGIEASPEQIMLMESGTQAIDLLCRLLIEPGDTVLVDDPGYFNFHALLRAHRANVVGVPYTLTGPDVDLFARAVSEHRPRLYITNSAIHNPTGAALSPVVAHRVLKLADQAGMTIIEDDIWGDFEHTLAPRLAAFDGLHRVVHIGSFSKTLSASLRCGYIAAPGEWIDKLIDLKIATTFGGARLSSELVLTLLKDGSYRKHMEAVRARLSRAMAETAARLKPMGFKPYIAEPAGIFLWCRVPDGIDATEVAHRALANQVVLAPGNAFSVSQTAGNFMRFNVAQCDDDRIFKVLKAAMRA